MVDILKQGDFTVKKLSHKKLLVQTSVPFFHMGESEPFLHMDMKFRYSRNDKIDLGRGFSLVYPDKFISYLSNRMRIKKKNIRLVYFLDGNHQDIDCRIKSVGLDREFDSEIGKVVYLSLFVEKLVFDDPSWSRDYKLRQIFEDGNI